MESIELKMRDLTGDFPAAYTRKIIGILREPELSVEVQPGKTCEDVSRVIESFGYHIGSKKEMDGWILMRASKGPKK